MTRRLTILAVLVCSVFAMLFGAAGTYEGVKQHDPIPMSPDTSAPDAWGYTWVRSTDPGGPTFSWVDISTVGTVVNGLTDDNVSGPFPMQFTFPYYWYEVSNFTVGSNGYIAFGSQPVSFASPFAQLPNTSNPQDILAALVGDLVFSGQAGATGTCYYYSNGADSLVVSFINVTEWEQTISPTSTHTFQIILNKQDSSITFQYGAQNGAFNSTNNTTLCIGIENQTGQIGLNYTFSSTPPHALLPANGLAIKFKRTTNTGLQITDAGVVGSLNTQSLARVIKVGEPEALNAVVKNFGTANLTNVRVVAAVSRTGQLTFRDTVFVPSLSASQVTTVVFPRLFTPAVAGSYSAQCVAFIAGDQGPGNNTKTAEILSASFSPSTNTRIAFEGGTSGGSINWIGGGGVGVAFDLPTYPVRIESVQVNVTGVTVASMLVELLDGSTGFPGAVLATRTVTAVVGINNISFVSDSVRINGGRFFVGARGQIAFTYETTPPISNRSWEYTGGWAPYRSGDLQDVMIRVMVRSEPPPPPPTGWTTQTSGQTVSMRTIKAISQSVGWIGGSSGKVLRTTNGGTNWVPVHDSTLFTGNIHAITALDQNNAIIASSPTDAFLYRTINGGITWAQVYSQVGGFIDAVHMFDATNGIAVGDPVGGRWTIVRTTDGGATWVQDTVNAPLQVGTEAGWVNSFHAFGPNNMWFGGSDSTVYRTTNGGLTWSFAPVGAAAAYAVWFNDTQNGVVGFASGTPAQRTTDGGVTWSTVTIPGTGSVYGIGGAGTRDFWMTRGAAIYRSTDNGATWNLDYTSTIGTGLRHLNVYRSGNTTSGWVGSSTGGIASLYGTITDVGETPGGSVVPQEFALSQNYPNPFNPSTTIRYNVPKNAFVTLRIYDLLGQEVATLRNEMQNVGSYDVVWNGRNKSGQTVASGVYFYRLEARPASGGESFTSINKMLMLK